MKYEKPEICVSEVAVTVIQGTSKSGLAADAFGPPLPPVTASAYEADE